MTSPRKIAAHSMIFGVLFALFTSGAAHAATIFSPICQTDSDGVLFLAQSTHACPGSLSICRERIWSYATLNKGQSPNARVWSLEPLGSARLDESASPVENAKSSQQFFKSPKSGTCSAFFRSARLPSPDLADSTDLFRYSFEKGQLMVHWRTNKSVVPFVTRWNIDTCKKNCGPTGSGPVAKEATKTELFDLAEAAPFFDLRLDDMAILGFADPKSGNEPSTSIIVSVHLSFLKKTQAFLLYNDAISYSQSARNDLLGGAMITGLLDAALQLNPDDGTIRLEYARHLASQGATKASIRELKALPPTNELKKTLEGDVNFQSIRQNADFKALLNALP